MKKTKVGAKPKYKEGVEVVTLHALVPKDKKNECLTAIDEIVKNEKR